MADTIVVLAGELVGRDTHKELLKAGGRYARLFSLKLPDTIEAAHGRSVGGLPATR